MLTRIPLFSARRPACPYCGLGVESWLRAAPIQPCRSCRRPLMLARSLRNWNGPRKLVGLLDVGFAIYGIATVALLLAFLLTSLPPRWFMRIFAVHLFLVGTILGTDGALGMMTGLDRTLKRASRGRRARMMASFKIAAAVLAIILFVIGIGL